MKTVKVGRNTIEVWDNIDELPVKRFHKFNKFMLIDSGVGSDLNDVNSHIAKIRKHIALGNKEEADKLLENMRQALYLIAQETHVRHLSFAALIKSVNGKEVTDLSDENMQELLKLFNKESHTWFDKLIDFVKKKLETQLSLYFPGNGEDTRAKEYYDMLRKRVLLQLAELTKEVDFADEIDRLDTLMLTFVKPKAFAGKGSAEIAYEKQFDEMCLILKKELNADPDSMTVLQFYNAFEHLKKIKKPQKKNKNGR